MLDIFHCVIVGHILECLVWWHSMSYVGYYLRLGHTPILEFIRCFADFSHYSIYFLIFASCHTGAYTLSGFIISHVDFMVVRPICWYFRVFYWGIPHFHWVHYPSHFFRVLLGIFVVDHIPCFLFLLWVFSFADHILLPFPLVCLRHPSFVSLRHPSTVSLVRALPFFHQFF